MSMTAQEWIDNAGAGYNFGNTLEVHIGNDYHQMKQFYTSYVSIVYGETSSNIIESFTIGTSSKLATITLPDMSSDENALLKLSFLNPKLITTESTLGVTVVTLTLTDSNGESIDLSSLVDIYECDPLINGSTSIVLDLGKTATEISGGTLILKYIISKFPKSNDTELKLGLCHSYMPTGTPELTKNQIYAVYKAGFKSIRFPITWMNHMDGDTYVIDEEWLSYIAKFVDYAIELGMQVVINLHHDDNSNDGGWLMSDTYITDIDMQTKYKTIWRQIGEYFADRSDKLAFAGYNETRGSDKSWSTSVSNNLYGIIKIGEDFYDTLRSIEGNETRVLVFPTYASKYNMMGSFTNSETGKTETFHLPSDDLYCCTEVHIYETSPSIIKSQIDSVISHGIPFFIGEYGISKDSWNNIDVVRGLQYLVSYSRYKGIGTFLWDDYGGMGCLIRTSATSENAASNPKIWRGNAINAIPYICKCGILKCADIKTKKRLKTYITRDTDQIYLDAKTDVIFNVISGSSYGSCTSSGEFSAGKKGECKILALSADGYYNVITLSIIDAEHLVENVENLFSDISDIILKKAPSEYSNDWDKTKPANDINRYAVWRSSRMCYGKVIEVSPSSYFKVEGQVTIDCTTVTNIKKVIYFTPYCIEVDSSGNFVKYTGSSYTNEFTTDANTKYVVIGFTASDSSIKNLTSLSSADSVTYSGVKITTKVRDMEYDEHPIEERFIQLSDFSKYDICLRREFNIIGGMDYNADFGIDCDIHLVEFNERGEILKESDLVNGDTVSVDIFTTKILLTFYVPAGAYYQLVKQFNNKSLIPKFIYNDYIENEDNSIHEDFNLANYNLLKVNGKLLTNNGKILSR